MATDIKNLDPNGNKTPTDQKPPTMKVQQLIFREAIDLPGRTGASSVMAQMAQTNTWRYQIDFYPHLRHHRVESWKGGETASVVKMIHETLIKSWEPA